MWSAVGGSVHEHNVRHAGDPDGGPVCHALHASDGSIVGGVIGEVHWGWFHVDLLWVHEDYRGQGHGHRLLVAAEDEARSLGATRAYLDTFTFQAPGFYHDHGYRLFGELPDFPPGHARRYLRKEL